MKKAFRAASLLFAVLLLCGTLAACSARPSLDAAKAVEALEAAEYTVSYGDEDLIGSYRAEGLDLDRKVMAAHSTRKDGSKEITVQYVAIYYFPDIDTAKAAMERVCVEAAAEKTAEHPDWTEPVRYLNIIYYGTAAAIATAK